MSSKKERIVQHQAVLKALTERGIASLAEIARTYGVTERQTRRLVQDLADLAPAARIRIDQGMVKAKRGSLEIRYWVPASIQMLAALDRARAAAAPQDAVLLEALLREIIALLPGGARRVEIEIARLNGGETSRAPEVSPFALIDSYAKAA